MLKRFSKNALKAKSLHIPSPKSWRTANKVLFEKIFPVTLALPLCLCVKIPDTHAASLDGLGDLAGGNFRSEAYAVSPDGNAICGSSYSANGIHEAFLWTQANGMVGLGDLAGGDFESSAKSTSSSGSVVVGYSVSANGMEAFRWTAADGMIGLGDLAGGAFSSSAHDVSLDGNVVVGTGQSANGMEAFRWTATDGMVGLGDLGGGFWGSSGLGISTDGSTVVGWSDSVNGTEAFRWTLADGMVGLGDLAGGGFDSVAYSASEDGSVVVGHGFSADGWEAFRWTQEGGMIGLGDLAGGAFSSSAYGVSADGNVVVGYGASTIGTEAFYWTQSLGMRALADVLADDGVDTSGWTLMQAKGVSSDGTIVVGSGTSPNGMEAFIANVAAGGLLSVSDTTASVQELQTSQAATSHVSRNGVQAALPTISGMDGLSASPIVSYVKGSSAMSGGVAVNYRTEKLTFLGGVGVTKAKDDLRYGGETSFDGPWLGAGVATSVGTLIGSKPLQPLEISMSVNIGKYDADMERQYLNGASVETSIGDADLNAVSVLARIGWRQQLVPSVAITPYGQIVHTRTTIDAYTEQSGVFPGQVSEQKDSKMESSLGVTVEWQPHKNLNLSARAAWINLNSDTGAPTSVYVPTAATTFTSSGKVYDKNWGELGLDAAWRFNEQMALNGEIGATEGSDYPEDWYARIGVSISF